MPWIKKLAAIATAAEAARRYAKKNPEQAGKYLDQAAAFVDKQTKGRYTAKIDGATQKVKGVAGVHSTTHGSAGANGQYAAGAAGYSAPQPSAATTPPTTPSSTSTPPTTPTSAPQAGSTDKK